MSKKGSAGKACALVAVLAAGLLACAPGGVTARQPSPQGLYAPDAYEPVDDSWATAPVLPPVSRHTLQGEPGAISDTRDVDWFKVTVAEAGTPIQVHGRRIGGAALDLWLDIYPDGGAGMPATVSVETADDTRWPRRDGSTSGVPREFFAAPAAGTYWLRVSQAAFGRSHPERDAVATAAPGSCSYELWVGTGAAARLSGADRYATTAEVARLMWPEADSPDRRTGPDGRGVIIASGPSAAAAVALSVKYGMPMMLTSKYALPDPVKAELHRLATAAYWGGEDFTVYICGGTSSTSPAVERTIASDEYVSGVVRLAGPDRAGSAAQIADRFGASSSVFLVNGWGFADSLSAGPVAAWAGQPMLYCRTGYVPTETVQWMTRNAVTTVTVCGGPASISTPTLDVLQARVPGTQTFIRVAGADRYETSYRLAELGVNEYGMNAAMPMVASGENFPDAFAVGQLSRFTGGPVLLTPGATLSPWVRRFRAGHGSFADTLYVVGGTASVSPGAFSALNDMLKTP